MNWRKLSTSLNKSVYKRTLINQCYICQQISQNSLCQHCLNSLIRNTLCCPTCKEPSTQHSNLCGRCQTDTPLFDYCCAPYQFDGLIKKLLHDCKFHQKWHFIEPLIYAFSQQLWKEYQTRSWPEELIYVPSHTKRLRERGFCLTRTMSQTLHQTLTQMGATRLLIPLRSPIKKVLHTQEQHKLSRKERLLQPINPYQVIKPVAQHIALFDDVMTTGSTLNSCIQVLRKAGAKRIDVWVIARTPAK
ncbi:ComF family protein [Marinomonas epiphytica]